MPVTDNVPSNPGSGSPVRCLSDGTNEWPAGVVAYVTGGSAGAWTLQTVDASHGLPVAVVGTVVVDGSGVTQPISAVSLPLPAGAATSAKQPALGTAGTAATDVLSIQGIAGMTAVKVDGSGVTQPISGSVSVTGTVTVSTHAVTQSGTWSVRNQDGSGNALTSLLVGTQRAQTVAIVDGSGNQITTFGGSGGTSSNFGSAVPSAGTAAGFSDGTNMQAGRVFDVDTGAGTQYVMGVSLRASGSGGSTELLGQQAMAGSIPVVLASNQSNVNVAVNAALPAGSNAIGAVTQSGSWTVTANAGTNLNTSLLALESGGNLATIAGAVSSGKVQVNLQATTAGGSTPYSYISAGSANQDSQSVKGSAGQVYGWQIFNTSASVRYVKVYDKATAPTSADTPVKRFLVPAGGGLVDPQPGGVVFSSGIGIRITTGAADNDTGAASASDVLVNINYK